MLPRTLEPEVMDTLEEAVDYDSMDHTEVNRSFAETFLEAFAPQLAASASTASLPSVLDVGTGTARIPIEICQRSDRLRITAIDLSANMLQLAQRNVIAAGLMRQIRLEQVDAKGIPYPDETFAAVISNSIIHHIPQPIHALREMVRVLRPGGLLFVRDLLRPRDAELIAGILAKHAGGTNEQQRQLFEQSLHASLTLPEVSEMLQGVGLSPAAVHQSSDRHWTIQAVKE
jgi:ubiquinone/menaquinone biosynthesis C-methylase UbiE